MCVSVYDGMAYGINNNQHFAFNMWDFRISFLLLFNFEVELIIQIIYRTGTRCKKTFFFSLRSKQICFTFTSHYFYNTCTTK